LIGGWVWGLDFFLVFFFFLDFTGQELEGKIAGSWVWVVGNGGEGIWEQGGRKVDRWNGMRVGDLLHHH
jgi:hypothetical protein